MDHTRVCPACRALLLGTSELLVTPRASGRSADVARPMPDIPDKEPQTDGYLVETKKPATKKAFKFPPLLRFNGLSKRTAVTIAIVAAIGWSLRLRAPEGTHRDVTPKEILIDSAMRDGLPYWESPVGRLNARPKVVRVYLPRGNDRFEMHLLAAGEPERVLEFKDAEDGISFEKSENVGPEGAFPCIETLIPFPDEETLHLDPGKTYFVWARLPNGCESIPMRLTLKK